MLRLFSNSNCHCEPFASCHSEHSEESHGAQDRLREAILLLLSEIASVAQGDLAMTTKQPRVKLEVEKSLGARN